MSKKHNSINYLNEITGILPKVRIVPDTALKQLPYFLRDSYTFKFIELMDHRFVLASTNESLTGTPGQLAAHEKLLHQAFDVAIAFEFEKLPSYLRQRLILKSIAFLVPGTALFMPFMMMDFRSKSRVTMHSTGEAEGPLSWPAQMIVLFHLQRSSLMDQNLGQLSAQFGYSAMTLSRVLTELANRGLCEIKRDGVRKHLQFETSGQELWKKALPYLRNPVVGIKAVKNDKQKRPSYLYAGMSGLSEYSSLADDTEPTFALSSYDWRHGLDVGSITELAYLEEGSFRFEIWGYNPRLLAEPGEQAVDRLSLYLSCKESPNERIQSALKKLLEDLQWLKD